MHSLELVYCAAWHYAPRAVRAMAEIINDTELEGVTKSFNLIPSDGGRFEFSIDGQLVYSKLQTGRHVEDNELRNLMKEHLAGE